jgi:PhnB protein
MRMAPYLSFRGDCEAAFSLYADCFGGKVGEIFRYGGSPMAGDVPPDWADKVMHGSVTIGDQTLMGSDNGPDRYEKPAGMSLSIHLADPAEAERIFARLSDGGSVTMPLAQTFWAKRFGALVDRYGVPWSINCE